MSIGDVSLSEQIAPETTNSIVPEAAASDTVEPTQVAEGSEEAGESAEPSQKDYEDFTLPDGWVIADADLDAFAGIAQGLKLDQAGAQQLVDMFIGIEGNRAEYLGKLQAQQTADRDSQWQEQLQNDPEIGGDKFATAQANINVLEDSGVLNSEFKEMLIETGQFKNPAVIKQLATLGQMLQEDPTAFNSSPADGKTQAQRMFANSGHV